MDLNVERLFSSLFDFVEGVIRHVLDNLDNLAIANTNAGKIFFLLKACSYVSLVHVFRSSEFHGTSLCSCTWRNCTQYSSH